jgi:hypothetical protein
VEVLATTIRQEKKIKDMKIGKEKTKLSLFIDHTFFYTENTKDATKKL